MKEKKIHISRKGKKYEEIYGIEKSRLIRYKMSKSKMGNTIGKGYKHPKKFCEDISKRLMGHKISEKTKRKIDENYHKKQIEKDQLRQKNITNELNCSFLRIPVRSD